MLENNVRVVCCGQLIMAGIPFYLLFFHLRGTAAMVEIAACFFFCREERRWNQFVIGPSSQLLLWNKRRVKVESVRDQFEKQKQKTQKAKSYSDTCIPVPLDTGIDESLLIDFSVARKWNTYHQKAETAPAPIFYLPTHILKFEYFVQVCSTIINGTMVCWTIVP